MQLLQQSTVTTLYVGPVLDSTGVAVTNAVLADFQLIKNGTSAVLTGATVTHNVNGNYTIALTTGNTDTLGRLTIACNNAAHAMGTHRYSVVATVVFNVLITNGDLSSRTNITAAAGVVLSGVTHTGAVIPTVSAVTGLTVANLDAAISSRATSSLLTTVAGYLDTEIADIKAKTDLIPASPASTTNITAASGITVSAIGANVITAASIAADAGDEIANSILDLASGVETSLTVRQALRLILAASAGRLSGAATATIVIRNVGNTKDRITATVDADGNRTAVTTDAT